MEIKVVDLAYNGKHHISAVYDNSLRDEENLPLAVLNPIEANSKEDGFKELIENWNKFYELATQTNEILKNIQIEDVIEQKF